jgi:predicted acyl esterase
MVFQEIRSTFLSEGTFRFMRPHIPEKKSPADVDESSDAYDTVDWLLENIPGLPNTLVMGPWRHSGWSYFAGPNENRGVFPFSGTIAYFMENIELPFFNGHSDRGCDDHGPHQGRALRLDDGNGRRLGHQGD